MSKNKGTRGTKPDLKGIRQDGPNLYFVRVSWTNPETGKREERQRTVEGSLLDAIKERDELRELRDQAVKRPRRETLAIYARSWLESRILSGRIGVATADKYAKDLDLHVLPQIGKVYLEELTPSIVQPVLGTGHAGVNRLRMLRCISADALADRKIEFDFTARLMVKAPPGYTDEKPNRLSAGELGALLESAERTEPYWTAMLIVLGYTGLRWAEVSALRWDDLNYKEARIRIRQGNYKGIVVPRPENKKARSVPMDEQMIEVMKMHRQRMLVDQHPGLSSGWCFPVSGRFERKKRADVTDPWLHTGSPLTCWTGCASGRR